MGVFRINTKEVVFSRFWVRDDLYWKDDWVSKYGCDNLIDAFKAFIIDIISIHCDKFLVEFMSDGGDT